MNPDISALRGDIDAARARARGERVYCLRLYVAGASPRSMAAFSNIRQICEARVPGRYCLEIVDVLREPDWAAREELLALPTLLCRYPAPVKKIVGDLSNPARVLAFFERRP